MSEDDWVGCNYRWPRDLLSAVKELAKFDGISQKQELFEGAAYHLQARVNADVKCRQFLQNAGYKLP